MPIPGRTYAPGRYKVKKVTIRHGLASCALLVCIQADSAMNPARTLSRANCMVPIPSVSPTLEYGRTFNESVSWDPKFWKDHYAFVRSLHHYSYVYYGIWNDKILGSYSDGDNRFRKSSWRFWAGTVDKGDTRKLYNRGNPYRWTTGDHWELLSGKKEPTYKMTYAVDCNLSAW